MQLTCTPTQGGNVYRFYGTNKSNVYCALKPIVPFLLKTDAEVIVGTERHDPGLLLRVGPIRGRAEAELLRLTGDLLVTPCPPMPA